MNDEILQEFLQLRKIKELERDKRREIVYEKIPRIREIDLSMKSIGLSTSRKLLTGAKGVREEAEEKIKTLRDEKIGLLLANGFSENFLEILYSCEKCKDSGILPDGSMCSCFLERKLRANTEKSSLKELIYTQNFDTFKIELFSDKPYQKETLSPRENMKINLKLAKKFVKQADERTDNLFFYGNTGLGKTFLSSAIAKGFLDRGKTVLYQSIFAVVEMCEAFHFRHEKSDIYEALFSSDLLIIDDLGSELVNEFTNSALFEVINTRIMTQKKLLISSNLSPEGRELKKKYSERIYSRIMQFAKLKFYGEDLRKKI